MMDIHLVSAVLTPTAGEISLLFNCTFQSFTEWHSRALGKDIFTLRGTDRQIFLQPNGSAAQRLPHSLVASFDSQGWTSPRLRAAAGAR
jgi:hypothetical protein